MFSKKCEPRPEGSGSFEYLAWLELLWREVTSKAERWAGSTLWIGPSVPFLKHWDLILSAVEAIKEL